MAVRIGPGVFVATGYGIAPPIPGQVLVAQSTGVAIWGSPTGEGGVTGPIGPTGPGAAVSLYGSQFTETGTIALISANNNYIVPYTFTGPAANVGYTGNALVALSGGIVKVTSTVSFNILGATGVYDFLSSSILQNGIPIANSNTIALLETPFSGVAPAFTPGSLSGLVLWLRGDLGVTTSPFQWLDQSSSALTFNKGSENDPTVNSSSINGQQGITMSSAGALGCTATTSSTALGLSSYTIYVVMKPTATFPSFSEVLVNSDSNAWSSGWGISGAGTAGYISAWSGNYVYFAISPTTLSSGSPYCVRGTWDGSTINIYLNGSIGTPYSGGVQVNSTSPIFLGTSATGGGGGGNPYTGDICEVVVVNRVLNSTELSEMAAYILARYGLVA